MGCGKVGAGIFAGNNACENAKLSNSLPENASYSMVNNIPYATTRINVENMIPIGNIASGVSNFLSQSKVNKALSGDKEYTKPKTIAGKFFGRLTGRTAGYEATQEYKAAQASGSLDSNINKSMQKQGFPISGGVQFGTEASPFLKMVAIIGAVVIAVVYFN